MPQSIYINGRFLTQPREGVQRAAEQVVLALDSLIVNGEIDPERYRFVVLAPPGPIRTLALERIGFREVGCTGGHLWEQLELPWHSRDGFLLNLGNTAPLLKRAQIVIVHDAAVWAAPHGYSRLFLAWYRRLLPALGKRSRRILTVSEFSRRELCRHAGYAASRVEVVRWGVEHLSHSTADPTILERHGLRGKRYVLAVSSLNPNKNFGLVLAALRHLPARLDVELVIAGGSNPRVFAEANGGKGLERAVHVGYVQDSELRALYEHAAAFVFPSLYEGFGFPPLEAMGFGCPVLASDIPVLREVCGEAALFFNPRNPVALAQALQEVLTDEGTASALRAAGLERVQHFRWRDCARQVFSAVVA